MTLYHPRALADKLEELVPELQRWSHRASMALDNAQIQQKRVEDRHLQTNHSAQMHEHQLVQDQECVRQDEELLQICDRNSQETLTRAQQTASAAQSILKEAQTAHNRTQQALQSAQEALAQAEQVLKQATADVESKMAEFAKANAHGAEGDKQAANHSLSVAKRAQNQASSAVQAASAHVANCTKAVTLAGQALQFAKVTHQQAQAGLKACEDSIGFVRAASRALYVGKRELGQEEATVKATSEALQHATQITQESSTQLVAARLHEQPAQLHTSDTLRALQVKIGLLMAMNQPELDSFSGAMVASLQLDAVAGTGELTRTQYPRVRWLTTKLEEIDGLKPRRWSELNLKERTEVLQHAHNVIAATYRFNPCLVEVVPLQPKTFSGYFAKKTGDIKINRTLVAGNDLIETLGTLVHESRHAYQWHIVLHLQRGYGWHSNADWTLAQEWSDNSDDYKSPERYGMREYRNQPVESDAFGFEETVIKLMFGR